MRTTFWFALEITNYPSSFTEKKKNISIDMRILWPCDVLAISWVTSYMDKEDAKDL